MAWSGRTPRSGQRLGELFTHMLFRVAVNLQVYDNGAQVDVRSLVDEEDECVPHVARRNFAERSQIQWLLVHYETQRVH